MKVNKVIPALMIALAVAACSKESVKTLYSNQETKIETIVKSLHCPLPENTS